MIGIRFALQRSSFSNVEALTRMKMTSTRTLIGVACSVLVALVILVGAIDRPTAQGQDGRAPAKQTIDHNRTAFPLTGQHKTLECEACHTGGRYEGLPTECSSCHKVPSGHVMNQQAAMMMGGCNACHTTTSFAGATFRHDPATTAGKCDTCHNGRTATGKPATHITTMAQCDQCHTTTRFAGATFRHDAATTGKCDTCHNGRTATGKPATHLATTAQCDQCHRTTGWTPASYANHNNPQLIGGHSTLECKACHPQSFSTAFYRDGIQFGFCSNCHRRDYTYPDHHKEGTDFNSSLQINANCAQCHRHAGYRGF
jgi:hypothetical protein